MNEFATIEEAQLTATQWLWIHNNERPSLALGGITPAMKLAEVLKAKTLYCMLLLKMGVITRGLSSELHALCRNESGVRRHG